MIKATWGDTKLLLVDDLNPQEVAMLQALYSRSAESAEIHLEKIYEARHDAMEHHVYNESGASLSTHTMEQLRKLALEGDPKADNFMSKFYVGYGHKSIADCGTTTLFIEGVSLLAAKAIQDWPLYNGQETSTRYIDMSKQRVVDPFSTPESRLILERWMTFYVTSQERVAAYLRGRYPRKPDEKTDVYERAIKARTFDILRGFLPAGITTQLSWHTNLRQAGDHLPWLVKHPAKEVADLGTQLQELLQWHYHSSDFGTGPALTGVGVSGEKAEQRARRQDWEREVAALYSYPPIDEPTLLPFFSTIRHSELERYNNLLSTRPRGSVLPHFMSDLGQVNFNFWLDFGSFRDIQRHRNGVCRMPLLSIDGGFEKWYLEQLDPESTKDAVELLYKQERDIAGLPDEPVLRQYYVAMGYKVPCSVTYGLPATVYVLETRSGKMIHPTLRRVIHQMIHQFKNVHPNVPLYVDLDPDDWDTRRGLQTILAK